MEVSENLVVLRDGHIEQVGAPREIYDRPANEFVMGFIGPVSRVDGQLVRPHDLVLSDVPTDGADKATVERVLHLGFEVRAEVIRDDGERVVAQLTKAEADALDLHDGSTVWLRSPALSATPLNA